MQRVSDLVHMGIGSQSEKGKLRAGTGGVKSLGLETGEVMGPELGSDKQSREAGTEVGKQLRRRGRLI